VIGFKNGLNLKKLSTGFDLPITVGILIFDQVEVLDVTGPFEVFCVTRLDEKRRFEESSPFRILLIAETLNQITAVGGLRFTPDVTIDTCPDLDLLIVPGGMGTRREVKNQTLVRWIRNRSKSTRLIASVCTGACLIGKSGLLDYREATTHWRTYDFLFQSAPKAKIRRDLRFTLTDPIFTSAGISAGIDLALSIVSHYFGTKVGRATAHHMEYPYPRNQKRKQ
jgi:transcriptional regulator GlxA family with amidase domain